MALGRFVGLAAAAVVLLLAGCAAPGDESARPAPAGSQGVEEADGAAQLAGQVTVFAAASLTDVFGELESRFEEQHPGVDVVTSFSGSSALAEQIVQGAPADVFAAADLEPMAAVEEAGLATDPAVFASNTLQLVVPAGNPGSVTALADLARPELAIALCDESVPCGAASRDLLTGAGVTAAPDTLEQDVRAVLTKVRIGEVDAGLVYRTDVIAAGDAVEGIDVDGADEAVNPYPIAALADAPNPDAATAFTDFVLSDDARSIFDEAGFGAP